MRPLRKLKKNSDRRRTGAPMSSAITLIPVLVLLMEGIRVGYGYGTSAPASHVLGVS
jgi:hypothetical protein